MKSYSLLFLVCTVMLSLFIASCSEQQHLTSFSQYYEDGRAKPTVAIVPVIDSTSYDLPWSISEELTTLLLNHCAKKNTLFISNQTNIEETVLPENPFLGDLSWVKTEYNKNEFVVFLELLEHTNKSIDKETKDSVIHATTADSSHLITTLRIRIIDIRYDQPKVVLQEVLRDSYYVSKTVFPVNYTVTSWKTPNYFETPLASAHEKMIKMVAQRINDYVLLAKSR